MSSHLILPTNGSRPPVRGKDFCTKDELMNAMMNTYGPLAVMVKEIMARQVALEDHLGYTYVPKPDPDKLADGTADGGAGVDGGDPES